MRQPPIDTLQRLPAASLMLLAAVTGIPGSAAASDYPPPPGAYHSEPAALPGSQQQRSTRDNDTAGTPSADPGRLALPADDAGGKPAAYDATTLFGAPPAGRHVSAQQAPDPGRAAPVFAPRNYAAQPPPAQRESATGFEPGRRATPLMRDGGEQGTSGYPGYPQYPREGSPAATWVGPSGVTKPATAMPSFYPSAAPDRPPPVPQATAAGASGTAGEFVFRPPTLAPDN